MGYSKTKQTNNNNKKHPESCKQTDFSRGTHAQRSLETPSKILIRKMQMLQVIIYNFIILNILLITNILQPVHSHSYSHLWQEQLQHPHSIKGYGKCFLFASKAVLFLCFLGLDNMKAVI